MMINEFLKPVEKNNALLLAKYLIRTDMSISQIGLEMDIAEITARGYCSYVYDVMKVSGRAGLQSAYIEFLEARLGDGIGK